MAEDQVTFSFGENWEQFIQRHFNAERVELSRRCLLAMLQCADLRGRSFVDIGCGSGLSSLAAFEAGADRIVSFDLDPASVRTTQNLRAMRGNPDHWLVMQGSVLDRDFLKTIEPADIAYSWGVLHHTGKMWDAVENAATLMKPDGLFFIALYTTTPRTPSWIRIKKRYNAAGSLGKRLMEARHVVTHMILPDLLLNRQNPLRRFQTYRQARGMSLMTDVRDWLGGWPYEDARVEEVLAFARHRLHLEWVNLKTGEACTEYVFRRTHSPVAAG